MSDTELGSIIYIKDGVSGTMYLTVDSHDPIAVSFFNKIKVQIILGVIKPGCILKALPSSSNEEDNLGVTKVGDELAKKSSEYFKRDLNVYSGAGIIPHKQKNYEFNKVLPCEKKVKLEQSLVESAQESLHGKAGAVCKDSLDERDVVESDLQYESNSESECSPSICEIKPNTTLRQHEENGLTENKTHHRDINKKTSNRKSKIRRDINKVKSVNESSLSGLEANRVKDKDVPKVKSDQPKEKRSAKWKLACQISCQYCLKVFENQQAFYDHKKTSRLEVFECCVCKKVFPFQAHLQAHTKISHSGERLCSNLKESSACICDICGSEVKNMFALKKHLMFHTREYFYKCCICGKQFVEPGTLNNHMSTHKSGGMIKCKCCDQLFATRGALARHKLASMEVKCHLCGEMFPNRTSRTQHYKVFHINDILKCSKCTSMFSSPEELTIHMKKHSLYKKKQCKTCGKFFSRLEKHVVTHKSGTEINESELFVCDKCPKKFTNRSSFQRHLTTHSQDKPYQCPNCPRRFADCGVLRKHLRRHMSLMPYVCEVCGKKCKEPGNLKVHMRIHSDTKQFQCSVCPQAFNYKSSLDGHMRSRHAQNLNSACLIPQGPQAVPAFEVGPESSPQQIYTARTNKANSEPVQPCENDQWKLKSGHNQTFTNLPNIEMKQFYENSTGMCMKPVYVESGIHPVNLMARQPYQDHPLSVSPAGLDFVSKQTYMETSASVVDMNMASSYTQEGNPIISGHSLEENPVNTLNVASLHVSLY